MAFYDIFNGDADGICALHQLRLAIPREAHMVTGAKREIRLLERVRARAGDELTVLDVSLESNREGIVRALWLTPADLNAERARHRSPLVAQCVEDCLAGRRFPLEVLVDPAQGDK